MTKYEQIRKAKDAYTKAVKELGKAAVTEELEGVFAEHPTLKAIRWTQYTPHFNDGDVCEFNIQGVYYDDGTGKEEESDYGDGFRSTYSWTDDPDTRIKKAVRKFEKGMDRNLFKDTFGDGVQVTATRDGVEVEEYDHD